MSRLQRALGGLRSVDRFQSPMLVASLRTAQRSQVSEFAQQATHGGQSRLLQILQGRFQRHVVTNSERSKNLKHIATSIAAMKVSRSNSQSQGENNHETNPLDPRSRSAFLEYSGNSNRRPR